MSKIKVSIIGATGYAGEELLRLLLSHPMAEIRGISSESFAGKKISEIYPSLGEFCDMLLTDIDTATAGADVVFAALPHGLSQSLADKVTSNGSKFIDLGADFRLYDEEDYKQWYGLDYTTPLHEKQVCCIPELHREQVKSDTIVVGNPGCYPTSVALAIAPAVSIASAENIIIDSKSGATGAGRALALNTHYTELNEAFGAYKVAEHRHTPEIEQTASELFGSKVTLTFVPHLLPVNRGILTTAYLRLTKEISAEEIHKIYEDYYKSEKFVRVMPLGANANTKTIKYTNLCDISVHLDSRTNTLIVCSAIDNMVKGAAGQAIQNMNIICGFAEETGLTLIPPAF
jgi:N-acetyl-gamma-glutamyl-phosphate reductase, common form